MKAADGLIRVLIDGDKHKKRLEEYKVIGYPTLLFLDPEGGKVGQLGSRDPAAVAKQLAAVVENHRRDPKWVAREARELKPEELDACWAAMAGADVAKAYEAMWTLGAGRAQAVEYLRSRLIGANVDERAKKLIEALDGDDVDARDKAAREPKAMGPAAEPALREALAAAEGERKAQIEAILVALESVDKARRGRAMIVLERLDAREMVETLAERGVKEAKAALERLKKK